MKECAIFLAFVLVTRALSQEININFLPEDTNPGLLGEQNAEFNKGIQETAIKTGECRPAELDLEGHWGAVVEGFQLSIRSETNVFTIGSPIPVSIILRNITTNALTRINFQDGQEVVFFIEDESGHVWHTMLPSASNVSLEQLAPRRQIKREYDLTHLSPRFNFEPGNYKIHTEQGVFQQSTKESRLKSLPQVSSSTLLIKIIPP